MKKLTNYFAGILCVLFFYGNTEAQTVNFKDVGTAVFAAHTVQGCNGELVDFEDGVFHYNVHGSIKGNGEAKHRLNLNFNLTGVGRDTGLSYRCVSAQHDAIFESALGYKEHFEITQVLIAQGGGSGTNMLIKFAAAIEIDSGGTVVFYVEDGSVVCPGS